MSIKETLSQVAEAISDVKGTAGEAYQMCQYTQMVNKYGEAGAAAILAKPLANAGLTIHQFNQFRLVREKIISGQLNIAKAKKEVDSEVHQTLKAQGIVVILDE